MSLPQLYSGKVRDIFDAGDGQLLMVASDRMSAFARWRALPSPVTVGGAQRERTRRNVGKSM